MNFSSKLRKIEKRLDSLEKRIKVLESLAFTNKQISSLPYHLLKTFFATYKLGLATASDISDETKRERAVESSYLNQLVTMGYLEKIRKGRKIYFEINYDAELTKNLLKFLNEQK